MRGLYRLGACRVVMLALGFALFACPAFDETAAVHCGPRVQIVEDRDGFSAQLRFTAGIRGRKEPGGIWRFAVSDANITLRERTPSQGYGQTVVALNSPTAASFTVTGTYQNGNHQAFAPATCRILFSTPHPDSGLSLSWSRPVAEEEIEAGSLTCVSFQLRDRKGSPAEGRALALSTDTPALVTVEGNSVTDARGMAQTRLLQMHPGSGHLTVTLAGRTHRLPVRVVPGGAHPQVSTLDLSREEKLPTQEISRVFRALFLDGYANAHAGSSVAWRLLGAHCRLMSASSRTTAEGEARAILVCPPDTVGSLEATADGLVLHFPFQT